MLAASVRRGALAKLASGEGRASGKRSSKPVGAAGAQGEAAREPGAAKRWWCTAEQPQESLIP